MRGHGWRLIGGRALAGRVALSLLALVLVGAGAATLAVRGLHGQTDRQLESSNEVIAERTVAPVVTQGVYDGNIKDLTVLDERVRVRKSGSAIHRITVSSAGGVVLYADDPRRIGQRLDLDPADEALIAGGGARVGLVDLSRSANVLDRELGRNVEVSTAALDTEGRPILVRTDFDPDQVDLDESALARRIVPVTLGALAVLWLLSLPLILTRPAGSRRPDTERA